MTLIGPSLVDPRSWGSHTFAVYGPGDVVYDQGPGSILNSGLRDDPYTLIESVIIRDRIPGTYDLYFSGIGGTSPVTASGYIGVSGTKVYARWTPTVPLRPNTQYQAVLVGEDIANDYIIGSGRYLGVTSWTSDEYWTASGVQSSGNLKTITSYDRILPTAYYDTDTGYNDTYTIEVISGSTIGAPKFQWSQRSSVGTYTAVGSGIHSLGDNLGVLFSGIINSGTIYTLDVYVPRPLETTYQWTFTTATLDASVPPTIPTPPPVIINQVGGGLVITQTPQTAAPPLQVLETWPAKHEYAVVSGLPIIIINFNKPLKPWLVTSGLIKNTDFPIKLSPLMGMPNTSVQSRTVYPASIEVSGSYLKLWM